ncbi:MAG TPA: DUF2917 domain-containing protein [Burkholderiales bacterium]|nr:DUF2917 domain-containing protein [Burkholderiales bacterium]HTQ72899.1 DUF2917 domain-containing protein [Burkholderiales bacterium]
MGAQDFDMVASSIVTIEPGKGRAVRIRKGSVWLTQEDRNDYVLEAGQAMQLNADGKAVVSVHTPTLLELYRADPWAVRARVERDARLSQSKALWAAVRRIFFALASIGETRTGGNP